MKKFPGNIKSQNMDLLCTIRASLVAQRLKPLPPMRETQVRSLGGEDPLEKKMATHSSILAWRIPRTEKPGRLQSMGSQRVGHDCATSLHLSAVYIAFILNVKLFMLIPWGQGVKSLCIHCRGPGFYPWLGI